MHQFEWKFALERARQRLLDLQNQRKPYGHGTDDLPPLTNTLVLYRDRLRVLKTILLVSLATAGIALALQEWRIHRILRQLREKEYFIVPGAPEFMRLRPGFVPKESVFLFSEYVASMLGTFSYGTVQSQYAQISEFMNVELKQRFLRSLERNLQNFRELRVDEVFEFDPVRDFEIRNDERGPKYIVRIKGTTRRYVEGTLRETSPGETLILSFRTTPYKPNRPWFFEIDDFERLSSREAVARSNSNESGKEGIR